METFLQHEHTAAHPDLEAGTRDRGPSAPLSNPRTALPASEHPPRQGSAAMPTRGQPGSTRPAPAWPHHHPRTNSHTPQQVTVTFIANVTVGHGSRVAAAGAVLVGRFAARRANARSIDLQAGSRQRGRRLITGVCTAGCPEELKERPKSAAVKLAWRGLSSRRLPRRK